MEDLPFLFGVSLSRNETAGSLTLYSDHWSAYPHFHHRPFPVTVQDAAYAEALLAKERARASERARLEAAVQQAANPMLPAVPGAAKYASTMAQATAAAAAAAAAAPKVALAPAKPLNPSVPNMGYEVNGSYVRQARYRPGVTVQSKRYSFTVPKFLQRVSSLL